MESFNKLLGDRSRPRQRPLHKWILSKACTQSSIWACRGIQRWWNPPPMSSPPTHLITMSFQKGRAADQHARMGHLPWIRKHRHNMERLVKLWYSRWNHRHNRLLLKPQIYTHSQRKKRYHYWEEIFCLWYLGRQEKMCRNWRYLCRNCCGYNLLGPGSWTYTC